MYGPPSSRPSRSECLAFASARGFGIAVAAAAGGPAAVPVPFCLEAAADGTTLAVFHLARRNPLLAAADGVSPWLLHVGGDDAYVSADWYASVDQVPTWLYQAVQLRGPIRVLRDDELAVHLDALSAHFEQRLAPKPPWTTEKMTPGRLDAMKKAIVGCVLRVEDVAGSFKLNQHKSDADMAAIGAALARQPDAGSRAIAQVIGMQRRAAEVDDGKMQGAA
jgi:transcriptional regulator